MCSRWRRTTLKYSFIHHLENPEETQGEHVKLHTDSNQAQDWIEDALAMLYHYNYYHNIIRHRQTSKWKSSCYDAECFMFGVRPRELSVLLRTEFMSSLGRNTLRCRLSGRGRDVEWFYRVLYGLYEPEDLDANHQTDRWSIDFFSKVQEILEFRTSSQRNNTCFIICFPSVIAVQWGLVLKCDTTSCLCTYMEDGVGWCDLYRVSESAHMSISPSTHSAKRLDHTQPAD